MPAHPSWRRAHVEGKLKAEILQDPAAYVSRDPEMAQVLLAAAAATATAAGVAAGTAATAGTAAATTCSLLPTSAGC